MQLINIILYLWCNDIKLMNTANRTYYIYTLTDPNTGEVRYVGCTINPKTRLSGHLSDLTHNPAKTDWIKQLKASKLKPIFKIELTSQDLFTAIKQEQRTFCKYNNGNLLCNTPTRFRYANKPDCKKIDKNDSPMFSPIIASNFNRLLNLNNLSLDDFKKNCRYTHSVNIDALLSGKKLFCQQDLFFIQSHFDADWATLLIKDYKYELLNKDEAIYSNRFKNKLINISE